ncbi:nuclear transport factor 2 family protein [Streptomyces sp. T028]|uniref:nuclear transport factor 2 family protein n=1 Tax=Streptomyces sp. T028 TaxID=3394379 RepID=UPI003A83F5B2
MTAPTAGHDVRSDIAYGDIGRWHDADALTAYMEHAHARCGHLMHRVTNTEVTLDGDTATARSYCDALVLGPDNDGGMQASGCFDDDLVRTDQGWRITHRRYTLVLLRAVRNAARPHGDSGDSHAPR